MKKINNEAGSALILTLLITLIFAIVGVTIIGSNINSAKQLTIREKEIQATDLKEMGLIAVNDSLDALVSKNISSIDTFKAELSNIYTSFDAPPYFSVTSTKGYALEIKKENIQENSTFYSETWVITSYYVEDGVKDSSEQIKMVKPLQISMSGQPQNDFTPTYYPFALHSEGVIDTDTAMTVNGDIQTDKLDGDKISQGEVFISGDVFYKSSIDCKENKCTIQRQKKKIANFNPKIEFDALKSSFEKSANKKTVNNNIIVNKGQSIVYNEPLTVKGNVEVYGDLIFNEQVYIDGNLEVYGSVTFNDFVYIKGNFITDPKNGDGKSDANTSFKQTAYIEGNAELSNNTNAASVNVLFDKGVYTKGNFINQIKNKGSLIINSPDNPNSQQGGTPIIDTTPSPDVSY